MSVFQTFKFGLKIIEILHKFCCSVDVLQEIAFNLKCITVLSKYIVTVSR